MLKKIEKILVVIQETDKIEYLLTTAIQLCKEHHAVMEILFIHESPLFELPDYFKRRKTQSLDKRRIETEIETMLFRLGNTSSYAVFIEDADTVEQVVVLNQGNTPTLIVSFYHEEITPKLAKKVTSPLLVMKSKPKTYQKILFPVDLNQNNKAYILQTHSLFPNATITLLYEPRYIIENYIFDADFISIPLETTINPQVEQKILETQKEAFKALQKETGLKGKLIDGIENDLIHYINTQKSDLLIIHSEHDNFLFENTLSQELITATKTDLFIL